MFSSKTLNSFDRKKKDMYVNKLSAIFYSGIELVLLN